MGANDFAIYYSTGSNDDADWTDNFKFYGQLFVTDKDGDIIEESSARCFGRQAAGRPFCLPQSVV